jgi:hypothetical protein
MSTADLLQVWEAAKADPFYPSVSKDSQFFIGALLLLIGMSVICCEGMCLYANDMVALVLSGVFALNRSIVSLPVLGIPASLAFG